MISLVPSWHVLDHTHIPYWFRWSPSGENATISQPRQLVVCLQSPQTVLFVFEMFVEEKKSIIGRNLADSLPFATQPHTSRHHTSTISKQNSRRRRIFKLSFFLYYSCYRQDNTILRYKRLRSECALSASSKLRCLMSTPVMARMLDVLFLFPWST